MLKRVHVVVERQRGACFGFCECMACPRDQSHRQCRRMVVSSRDVWCVRSQLPIPWNTLYTVDFINEMTADHVCPEGVLTFQDLGVEPRPVRALALPPAFQALFAAKNYRPDILVRFIQLMGHLWQVWC